jgi:hypothetical protein
VSSRRSRRGLTKRPHPFPPPKTELVSFNDVLKKLDREGKLGAFMDAWVEFERKREAAP